MKRKPNILVRFFRLLEIISRTIFTLIGLSILAGIVFIIVGFIGTSQENNADNDSAQAYKLDQIAEDKENFAQRKSANIVIFDPLGTIKETYNSLYNYTDFTHEAISKFYVNQGDNIISLFKIQAILDDIAKDENIQAVVFDYTNVFFEDDLVREKIMKALQKIQASGKKIISVADIDFETYMVSSVADAFIVDDIGDYMLTGYSTPLFFYFKEFFDRFGVEVNTAHAGKYKSAIENATRTNMSVNAEGNIRSIYSDFWSMYLGYISQNRKIQPQVITNYISNYDVIYKNYSGNMAQASVDMNLASHIYSGGNKIVFISNVIADIAGLELADIQYENFEDYAGHREDSFYLDDKVTDYNIVVTPLIGEIQYGSSTEDRMGLDSVVSLIKELKKDDKMQALVLRLNSPGGYSDAAAKIRRELLDLRRENSIPIVVSMGKLNASGGYYISTASEYMLSEPFTISGSIGVFFQQKTYENTLEKFGINTDYYETTWLDNAFNPLKNPSERMKNFYQSTVDTEYDRFIKYVAQARNMPIRKVRAIAQGRIYTGRQTYALGLSDEVGDLNDAIHVAAEKANIAQQDIAVHYILPTIETNFTNTITSALTQHIKLQLKSIIKNIFNTLSSDKLQVKL